MPAIKKRKRANYDAVVIPICIIVIICALGLGYRQYRKMVLASEAEIEEQARKLGISRTAISRDSSASNAQLHQDHGVSRDHRRTTADPVFSSGHSSNISEMCNVSPDKAGTHKKMVDEDLELDIGVDVKKEESVEVLDQEK